MSIKESALTAIQTIADTDFFRAVTSVGASRKVLASDVGKYVLEDYESELAGSEQSVTDAIDAVNDDLNEKNADVLDRIKKSLIVDSASGSIASFNDGNDVFPFISCAVNIKPIQDLHGYDKPWVGGAGKNKANLADGTRTGQGITGTVSNQVISASGTATATYANINYFNAISITSGQTYTVMLSKSVSRGITFRFATDNTDTTYQQVNIASGATSATFTANNNFTVFRLYVSGMTVGDAVSISGLQVLVGDGSIQSFEPWENICPITGFTGCEVTQRGLNLISPNRQTETNYGVTFTVNADKSITVSGTASQTTGFRLFDFINKLNLQIGKTYHIKLWTDKASTITIQVYKNGSFAVAGQPNKDIVYTVPSDSVTNYVRIRTGGGDSFDNVTCKVMITLDEEATEYVPPVANTYTVSWQDDAGTVYGGTVDVVSGVLTVDRGYIASYNGETLPSTWISDRDEYASGTTPTIGAEVVYELATPTTYQLDPVQVACLLGQNNVWADCGDIEEVKFYADPTIYISNLLGTKEDNFTADSAISEGDVFSIGDNIYKATATIAVGETIAVGTNCTQTSITEQINALYALL